MDPAEGHSGGSTILEQEETTSGQESGADKKKCMSLMASNTGINLNSYWFKVEMMREADGFFGLKLELAARCSFRTSHPHIPVGPTWFRSKSGLSGFRVDLKRPNAIGPIWFHYNGLQTSMWAKCMGPIGIEVG